jgi:predicted phage terminase large subunit-like protein
MSQSSPTTQTPYETQLTEIFNHYVLNNKWIPQNHRQPQPDGKGLTPKQVEFLCLMCSEALYGGAAGGGKSEALLMAALMFADVSGYSAIIFRRTYADLALPEALIARSMEWLKPTKARWDAMNHIWHFPSGASLAFGYLEHENDKYRYQSAAFQYIGFDELTQFSESQYRYLFSRSRRLEDSDIPLRMRSASNPGNIGHDWVKQRFMTEGAHYGRVFIPARLEDNPNLDRQKYAESLNELDPITRRQYLNGDWTARHGGNIFQREWFQIVGEAPADLKRIRYWDLAATKPKENTDPDYTVGALLGEKQGIYYVMDVKRLRASPPQVEALIKQTAETDGVSTRIFMEQEPGSSGVSQIDYYARQVLKGFSFWGIKTTGPKEERAVPVSSASEAGNIRLVKGTWLNAFLDEFESFPQGAHDDQVDAVSGAFIQLHRPAANPAFLLLGNEQ